MHNSAMIRFLLLVIISALTAVTGNFITDEPATVSTSPVSSNLSNNGSTGSFANYGTGKRCPVLKPIDLTLKAQPCYVTFAPRKAAENIDNICYTMLPLPDDAKTYQLFISNVYCNGTNTVDSFIVTQNVLGTFSVGSPSCTFVDIVFGKVVDTLLQCDTGVVYRCELHGDCPLTPKGVPQPVIGMSFVQKRIPPGCWSLINDIILRNGFGEQDFVSLPMNLPSRCVLSQTCNGTPIFQMFQSAAGLNYNQRPNRPF